MKSYEEYLNEAAKKQDDKKTSTKKDSSSNRQKCILSMSHALKNVFDNYDLPTRKFAWEHLNSPDGKKLVERLLKNPKSYISDSEFVKLVTK